MPRVWYYYTGGPGNEGVLANYQLASTFGFFVLLVQFFVEFMLLMEGANPSLISSNLVRYIARTKSLQTAQPDTPAGAIKYAYSWTGNT